MLINFVDMTTRKALNFNIGIKKDLHAPKHTFNASLSFAYFVFFDFWAVTKSTVFHLAEKIGNNSVLLD